jgi:hypothetical protein
MPSLFTHRYFPHAFLAIALTSISINLISHRRTVEDERSKIKAQISVLESIKEQLQSDKPLSNEELAKLKKLVRPVDSTGHEGREKEEEVSWTNVFRSRGKPQASDGESELSKWDQQDLEKCAYETTQILTSLF